jgi:hypothetical protein
VDEQGNPQRLTIVRHQDMGLDDQALIAVRQRVPCAVVLAAAIVAGL